MPYCDGLKSLKLGTQTNPPSLPAKYCHLKDSKVPKTALGQGSAFSVHGAESVLNRMTTKIDYLDLRGFHYTIEMFFFF